MTISRVHKNPIKADVELLMEKYSLRQLDIATAVGVTPSNFSAMLNGYKPIPDNVIHGIQRLKQARGDQG